MWLFEGNGNRPRILADWDTFMTVTSNSIPKHFDLTYKNRDKNRIKIYIE